MYAEENGHVIKETRSTDSDGVVLITVTCSCGESYSYEQKG